MRIPRRCLLGVALAAVLCVPGASAQPDPATSFATINQPATLLVLPDGSGPTLAASGTVITVLVIDVSGTPMTGLVSADFEVDGLPPSAFADGFSAPATHDVPPSGFVVGPAPGQYQLTGALIAGGYASAAMVKVLGVQIGGAPLPLALSSPDIDCDGVVNLTDVSRFTLDLFGGYNARSDFHPDGVLNISDVGHMAASLGAVFPPGYIVDPVD